MLVEPEKLSWYQVPTDVKSVLKLAADNWDNTAIAQNYIDEALAKAADNVDVLVTAYRFFFYKNKLLEAAEVATRVVNIVKEAENFPQDWEQLKPILINRQNDPPIRLYLNAYAALGFVLAKLGELEKAKEIAARVKQVDLKNEFGAGVIFDILTRPSEEDDD